MSDSDGLGEFEDDDDRELTEIDRLYDHGTLAVRKKANQMNKEDLLYLYSRFKFINEGPCNVQRPGGMFNFEAKSKWDAWKALGNQVSKDQCKQEYIERLDKALPDWKQGFEAGDSIDDKFSKADQKGTFGVGMSTMMSGAEDQLTTDKNCLDYCKEGDINQLKLYFQSKNHQDVNEMDENNMSMLMWACDRGNLNIVEYLVNDLKANVNLQDEDGQTCLHYAVSCQHMDIIRLLVKHKETNIDIADNDGLKAIDLAENNSEIVKILTEK